MNTDMFLRPLAGREQSLRVQCLIEYYDRDLHLEAVFRMRVGFYSLNVIDLATLVIVGFWLLKRIVNMDRFHGLRVFVLTLLLSGLVFYFFFCVLRPLWQFDDALFFSGIDVY